MLRFASKGLLARRNKSKIFLAVGAWLVCAALICMLLQTANYILGITL